MRSTITAALVMLSLSVGGCATNISIHGDRNFDTSLREGESIGLVLTSYSACYKHKDRECGPESDLTAKQREFENCMIRAIKGGNPDVNVTPSEKFMPVLAQYPTQYYSVGTALIAQLGETALRESLTAMGLKYLVEIEVKTEESKRNTTFGADGFMWGVGREGYRTTWIWSRIYEVASGNEAGRLSTSLTGREGWMVPVLVIIPLPPVPYSAATETRTCKAMGKALAKFITDPGAF